MKLIRGRTFLVKYFAPDEGPDMRTLRQWIKSGILQGRILGERDLVYVDEEAWLASTGNKLADAILKAGAINTP